MYWGQGPEMCNVHTFMRVLREQYEDPLEAERAQNTLHNLKQGLRAVQEDTTEFRENAACIPDWLESVKLQLFRAGLNVKLVEKALVQDDPPMLLGWIQLVWEVENQEQQSTAKKEEWVLRHTTPKGMVQSHGQNR